MEGGQAPSDVLCVAVADDDTVLADSDSAASPPRSRFDTVLVGCQPSASGASLALLRVPSHVHGTSKHSPGPKSAPGAARSAAAAAAAAAVSAAATSGHRDRSSALPGATDVPSPSPSSPTSLDELAPHVSLAGQSASTHFVRLIDTTTAVWYTIPGGAGSAVTGVATAGTDFVCVGVVGVSRKRALLLTCLVDVGCASVCAVCFFCRYGSDGVGMFQLQLSTGTFRRLRLDWGGAGAGAGAGASAAAPSAAPSEALRGTKARKKKNKHGRSRAASLNGADGHAADGARVCGLCAVPLVMMAPDARRAVLPDSLCHTLQSFAALFFVAPGATGVSVACVPAAATGASDDVVVCPAFPLSLESPLTRPSHVAYDPSRLRLLLTDAGAHCVREILLHRPFGTPQFVRTVTGRGLPDTEDGPGAVAMLNSPRGVAASWATGAVFLVEDATNLLRTIPGPASIAGASGAGVGHGAGASDGHRSASPAHRLHSSPFDQAIFEEGTPPAPVAASSSGSSTRSSYDDECLTRGTIETAVLAAAKAQEELRYWKTECDKLQQLLDARQQSSSSLGEAAAWNQQLASDLQDALGRVRELSRSPAAGSAAGLPRRKLPVAAHSMIAVTYPAVMRLLLRNQSALSRLKAAFVGAGQRGGRPSGRPGASNGSGAAAGAGASAGAADGDATHLTLADTLALCRALGILPTVCSAGAVAAVFAHVNASEAADTDENGLDSEELDEFLVRIAVCYLPGDFDVQSSDGVLDALEGLIDVRFVARIAVWRWDQRHSSSPVLL